jgi:hypothetical protein
VFYVDPTSGIFNKQSIYILLVSCLHPCAPLYPSRIFPGPLFTSEIAWSLYARNSLFHRSTGCVIRIFIAQEHFGWGYVFFVGTYLFFAVSDDHCKSRVPTHCLLFCSGDDSNDGSSIGSPFQSVQACFDGLSIALFYL